MKVLVEYSFVINPEDGWQNIADFEKIFNEFLATRNLRAVRITTEDDREMFEIEKVEGVMIADEPKEQTIKQVKAQMTTKRDSTGKFIKINEQPKR